MPSRRRGDDNVDRPRLRCCGWQGAMAREGALQNKAWQRPEGCDPGNSNNQNTSVASSWARQVIFAVRASTMPAAAAKDNALPSPSSAADAAKGNSAINASATAAKGQTAVSTPEPRQEQPPQRRNRPGVTASLLCHPDDPQSHAGNLRFALGGSLWAPERDCACRPAVAMGPRPRPPRGSELSTIIDPRVYRFRACGDGWGYKKTNLLGIRLALGPFRNH
jgi:hypothetical protein